ncbi:hypothetical protein CEE44_03630 [Candidatus Woesearchaeota archaeon B3_Woes]|nr:MAG: hypothetical protein CEE44_03630 [Candidatus Woesearchaeota archaeon B3_Woes]
MKKKGLFIVILCLLSLFSITACDPNESLGQDGDLFLTIKNSDLIQGLFGASDGTTSLADDIIMMRLLFAILIFAALYGASQLPPIGNMAKNPRIVISIVISIISVIAIPGDLLKIAAQTYGGFILFVLLAVPIGFGAYLILGVFTQPTKAHFGIRFFISMLLWGLVYKISDGAIISGGAEGVWGVIGSIASFATWIFAIMTFYFFIRMFSAGSAVEGKTSELPEGTKETGRKVASWWRRRGGPEFNQITGLIGNLHKAVSTKNKGALATAVKKIKTIETRTKNLETWSYSKVKGLDSSIRDDALTKIQEATAAHRDIAEKLRGIKAKIPSEEKTEITDDVWDEIDKAVKDIDDKSKVARAKELEFLDQLK